MEVADQPFDAESVGDSEDADLVPLQSGEDWVAQLDDDLSRPASQSEEITDLQLEDPTCVTLLEWIRSDTFPPWTEAKSLCPELRFLWHHRNNLSADAAQKKLGSPWVGPNQVVRQATGNTVGIQKGPDTPIVHVFIHVDDLKLCPAPRDVSWTPGPSTAKSLCAITVAFRPGSDVSDSESTPSAIVSTYNNASHTSTCFNTRSKLDDPIDLTDHILSPFFVRDFHYQGCRFHSIAHLMCFRYAVIHGLRLFATSIRKWTRHLTDFPTSRFQTPDWQVDCRTVLTEIYGHLCISDMAVKTALIDTGPRPFCLQC